MKEEQISRDLYTLNKRYLDLFYSVGIYEKRKTIKKAFSVLYKYGSARRFKELAYIIRGFLKKGKKGNEHVNQRPDEIEFPDNVRVAVYTCIIGNYDSLKEPMYINNACCDFYAITDFPIPKKSKWKRMDIDSILGTEGLTPNMKNRYVKLHPHELFGDYDYSVYVDGSVTVVADMMPMIGRMINKNAWIGLHLMTTGVDCIYEEAKSVIGEKKAPAALVKKQIDAYRKDNYPAHNGLYNNTVIIRKHNQTMCIKVMKDWWEQLLTYTQRDQLSLCYVLWKNGISKADIFVIGSDFYRNPRFYWEPHISGSEKTNNG